MMDYESPAKEEALVTELLDTLGIHDFTQDKEYGRERGLNPTPTESQIRAVEKLYQKLQSRVSSKLKKDVKKEDSEEEIGFDLMSRKRVILFEGRVMKKNHNSIVSTNSKRYAILLNDVLLLTSEQAAGDWLSSGEKLSLHQVLPLDQIAVLNMKKVISDEDPAAFEVITQGGAYHLIAESESDKNIWLEEIEAAIFCIRSQQSQSFRIKPLGWQHMTIRGTIYSAAVMGNLPLLRSYVASSAGLGLEDPDECGMTALHWAAAFGHLEAVELLLDEGACDIDISNGGLNSALLVAAALGNTEIVFNLLNRGADPHMRNLKDMDCLFMAVVHGGHAEDLHDVLLHLKRNSVYVNQRDSSGASPLHVCAERCSPRPIQILVDCGADVNMKHGRSGLTPLQLACANSRPDPETVRSLLDKGAHPNWRDTGKKSAFDMVVGTNRRKSVKDNKDLLAGGSSKNLGDTLDEVSEFVQVGLPVLMELVRKGCRFSAESIAMMRSSFQEVITTGRDAWLVMRQSDEFDAYMTAVGASLLSSKKEWVDDSASLHCLLCAEKFTYTIRRHHCRACGILCCDNCSTKRLRISSKSTAAASAGGSPAGSKAEGERVCDGCFNRLSFSSFQWSQAEARAQKEETKRKQKVAAEYDAYMAQQQQGSKGELFGSSRQQSPPPQQQQQSQQGIAAAGASSAVQSAMATGADVMIALKEREDLLKQLNVKAIDMNQNANEFKKNAAKVLEQQKQKNSWLGGVSKKR